MIEYNAAKAYEVIFKEIIPECIEHFKEKTQDYKGGPAFLLLGKRGQFGDINRKFWKLYQSMWMGVDLEGESEEEILKDFFGHVLLTLFCIKYGSVDQPIDPEEMAAKLEIAAAYGPWAAKDAVIKAPRYGLCGIGTCLALGKLWTGDQKHWVCNEHYKLWVELTT